MDGSGAKWSKREQYQAQLGKVYPSWATLGRTHEGSLLIEVAKCFGEIIQRAWTRGPVEDSADFKRDLPDKQEFYVTSLDGKRAQIYPIAEWEKKEEVLAKMPSTSVAKIKFLDVTSYYGQMVEMDVQGRVLLPQILRDSARVDGEVVVLGKQGILEVVNHDDFKAEMVKAPLSMEDMAALAEFGL